MVLGICSSTTVMWSVDWHPKMDWNTVGELCDADYHPSFWGDVINHHLTACLFRNITMFYVAAKSTRQHQWNGHCSGCLFLWSPINIFRSHSFRCIFEIRRMQLSLPSRVACYTHVHSHIENNNRTTKNRTEPKKSNSIKCFRNKTPEKYTQMALIHPFDDRRVYYFCCCLLLFFLSRAALHSESYMSIWWCECEKCEVWIYWSHFVCGCRRRHLATRYFLFFCKRVLVCIAHIRCTYEFICDRVINTKITRYMCVVSFRYPFFLSFRSYSTYMQCSIESTHKRSYIYARQPPTSTSSTLFRMWQCKWPKAASSLHTFSPTRRSQVRIVFKT